MKVMIAISALTIALFATCAFTQQVVGQAQVQNPAASSFFFTPFSNVPPVIALSQQAVPVQAQAQAQPQSAALQASPSIAVQSSALLQSQEPSLNSINGQPASAPILPADLARAYTESNLRLAQAYKDAEIRLAAANQKAASESLAQAIAAASAVANAPQPQLQAAQSINVAQGAPVAESANQNAGFGQSLIPLSFPISVIPGLSGSIVNRASGR